ncbi:MAG: TAXI family TRAP transporter solute-binding subunit [Spirochaetaceae bacterium]|jgi:TRAP transporter TAXI family solute receptor|nr:TAXI family TRAP transporter solute-binding subunit [Spirochaetaceae bacterium]
MCTRLWIITACAFFGLLFSCEKPAKLTEIRLAAGGTTGTYYSYAKALAGIIEERLNIPVTVIESAASVANIALIESGAANFAFVQNDVMTYAYNGTNLFSTEGAKKDFAVIAGLYNEVCHIVARAQTEEIGALKGERVSVGEMGSGTTLNAAQIFEVFGMSFADIKPVYLGFGDSANALAAGEISAFFCTAGSPNPAIEELAKTVPIRILPLGDARSRLLMTTYPYYATHRIVAGTYTGLEKTINTVAVRATLIASTNIAADDVYKVVKVLFESKNDPAAHPKADELSPQAAIFSIPIPFHPGALRYYRELGFLK